MKISFSIQASILMGCWLLILAFNVCAEKLTVTISNQSEAPVSDVVISAHPVSQQNNPTIAVNKAKVIDQVDKEFIAHVTAIQVGTNIEFPNHDQIRHHVYSFSPAKNFDIPLYKGLPAKPILFDKPGVVTLGCNIHDWMSAYIYVVDTEYFSMSNTNGQVSLELPPGDYELRYWHPDIEDNIGQNTQAITLESGSKQNLAVQIDLKETWSFRRGPFSIFNRGRYP